jgi:hypothetical protein
MAASDFSHEAESKGFAWFLGVLAAISIIVIIVLAGYWSIEPKPFDIMAEAKARQEAQGFDDIPDGYVYANTLVHIDNISAYCLFRLFCSWMCLIIHLGQMLEVKMRINLCGTNIFMPQ